MTFIWTWIIVPVFKIAIVYGIARFAFYIVDQLFGLIPAKISFSSNGNHIQDGDILLCGGKGFVPWLIRWGTGSEYSHVAVVTSAALNMAIEAIPEGGVRAISIKNFKSPFNIYRIKPGKTYQIGEVASFLVSMLARKYEIPLKLGWKMFLRKLKLAKLFILKASKKKKEADDLQEDQDYFCSELVWKAFKAGGLDIVPEIGDGETTSPGDIARSSVVEQIV